MNAVLSGRMYAADAERDEAAAALREHYAAGRLVLPELESRLARVYAARTRAQIAAAFSRLPEGAAYRRATYRGIAAAAGLRLARVAWFFVRRVLWPAVRLAVRRLGRRLLRRRPRPVGFGMRP